MNRNKVNSNVGAAKQHQSNRSSSTSLSPSGKKQMPKPTESNVANNNTLADVSQKASLTNSNGGNPVSVNSGKGKTVAVSNSILQKHPTTPTQSRSPTSPTSPTPKQVSNVNENQAEIPSGQEIKSNDVHEQPHNNQQKTISFFDPLPTKTLSSTSVKSAGGTSKLKSAGSNNNSNQQQQKQVNINTNVVGATANNNNNAKPQDNGNKGGGTSQASNSQTSSQQVKTTTKTFPAPVTSQRYSSVMSRSMVSLERSRNFRAFIEKAMNEHKIFACCGVYPAIRAALKKRGWVEKPGPLAFSRSANATLAQTKGVEDESDVAWMTRVLKDYAADFIWVIRRDNIDWKNMTKEQLINRYPKAWFTTKVGLAACLQHMHWFSEAGVSDTFFPRCYRLCLEEERLAFQDDYRLTACMSYLRYFVDTFESKGHAALADVHSKITPLSVDFASRQLGNYIRMRRHEDIDWLLPPNFMTQHWDAFIHQYYAVVHDKKRLRFDSPEAVHVKYETAKKMLHKVAQYWPQIQLDGVYNMWICKPGARSRGKGIVIMNNLEKILDLLTQSNFRECNWVVQKYIERPMLIYKTKFDIRQWFLITDWTPLTVWFYKESYVRFCTKPFELEDFHESIHLCNNAIQCRYQNSEQRDSNLPDENMWSSDTFQAYLKTIGRLDAWPLIYSGMKQAIVGVLLASQETVESRKGCYELYGADFMLTEDFRPWLIEINSCPCMAASTSVTARMCTQCLEDTIKVVLDRRNNRNADTGLFEMIYKQNVGSVTVQQFSGHDLTVVGKKLHRDIDWPMAMSKSVTNTVRSKINSQSNISKSKSENNSSNNKQTLSELLQKLRVRNQEMFHGALASQQIDSLFDGGSPSSLVVPLAKTDANALVEKMRTIKSALPQELEELSATKRIYPSPDVSKFNDSMNGVIEKESNPGKGEDPSTVASKFTDANSIAYLMRNSQNPSGLIGDLLRVSKETAQDLIVRTKKLEMAKKQLVEEPPSTPVPKTLAEVKAMVDSTALGKKSKEKQQSQVDNENHGKPTSTTHMTYLTSILLQANNDITKENNETSRKMESFPHFHNSSQESASVVTENNDCFSGNDILTPDHSITRSSSPKDPLIQPELTSNLNAKSVLDTETDKFNEIPSIIRKTKSLSFQSELSPLWISQRQFDLPELKPRESTTTKNEKKGTFLDYNSLSNNFQKSGTEETITIYSLAKNVATANNGVIHKNLKIAIDQFTAEDDNEMADGEKVETKIFEEIFKTPVSTNYQVEEKKETINLNNRESLASSDIEERELNDSNIHFPKVVKIDHLNSTSSEINNNIQELAEPAKYLTNVQIQDKNEKRFRLIQDKKSKSANSQEENDSTAGTTYESVLLTSTSHSLSDSDSDSNNNEVVLLSSQFIPISSTSDSTIQDKDQTVDESSKKSVAVVKPKPTRLYQRRSTISSSNRRCPRRFPCYKVILEPPNYQQQRFILNNKRKSGPTLPMKTVNLLLPSNYTCY